MIDPTPGDEPPVETVTRADGAVIAYRRRVGIEPGVIFLSGFRSDMDGTKATRLDRWAATRGRAFVRFDYFGHGRSDGAFENGVIGRWMEDALFVLDRLTEGPQILVGSSMGGWIACLLLKARPERVAGFVGLAPAPDFTEDLIRQALTPEMIAALAEQGRIELPCRYGGTPTPITRRLLEEAAARLVLRTPIPFSGPVRLLHGMQDPDVPWSTSPRLAAALTSDDVRITLIKDGDHRLSTERDLGLMCAAVDQVTDAVNSAQIPAIPSR